MKKKLQLTSLLLLVAMLLQATPKAEIKNPYKPKIQGTIRAKYEYNSSLEAHRFQVRNARFNVNGKLSNITSYKAEIDLSDEGKTKMLDAYVRIRPTFWFALTAGQQKIPFGTDNLRSPHLLYFANRSFVGKQLSSGLRDVGVTALFTNRQVVPFTLQAGVYNGDGVYDQHQWQKEMNYALRLEAFPFKNVEVSFNYNSIKPEAIRMDFVDIGAYTDIGHLHWEVEYIRKTYQNRAFSTTTSFSTFVAYDLLMQHKTIRKITPLLRYDMMTDNNKGKKKNGAYSVDDRARQRISTGLTISLNKPYLNDIRLNYEHYIYPENTPNNDNKVVVECTVRF